MKRSLILIPAFLFLVQMSKAQTEKGSQTLGVNLGFEYYNESGVNISMPDNSLTAQSTKFTSFSVGPSYSYFIADNLDLGATLNYSSNNYNYGPDNYLTKQDNKNYGGTIFLRKYVLYKNKIGFRVGPYLGYSLGDQKYTYSAQYNVSNSDSKSNSYEGGANLDLVYYPTKHLGVSVSLANLNYEHTKTNDGPQGFANTDQVNFNFINNNLALSLLYVFGGK
jgi:Outer membrane protein beta-barrel domain